VLERSDQRDEVGQHGIASGHVLDRRSQRDPAHANSVWDAFMQRY
jgi:hypothetical protein